MVLVSKRRTRVKQAAKTRYVLYALNFLFALQLAIVAYYMSSFIAARGVPEALVGIVYAAGAVSGAVALIISPHLLKRFGNYALLITLALINAVAFAVLGLTSNWWFLFIPFALSFAIPYMIGFSLDIFLENNTVGERETGGIRAIFITMANLAFVIAPAIGGYLVAGENFSTLFLVSASLMIPFAILSFTRLPYKDGRSYKLPTIHSVRNTLMRSKNMRNIFAVNFLLRIFYSVMVVYAPIYMHTHIGLTFPQIGVLSSVMLLAFVIVEIPLGRIGDSWLGEKEILAAGFVILSVSTIAVAFVSTPALWIWGLLLFITRVGAAMVDIMNESYFFKQIDGEDSDDVSVFRAMSPFAYTIGPILSVIVLTVFPLWMLFIFTGAILTSGIFLALGLKDTK